MSFREDGAAVLDWAAHYLARVGDLPVLAQVEPGEIRARLPASPPELGEPFADVLRDLDEILLPGITHWQSPRFFAYFAGSAAEPGILAELLAATLNSVGFIWRTSPASTELEALTLDWTAQLLGLPDGWHGHIEDTASVSTIAALAAAREQTGGRVVVCSEEAHSSVERAARLLGLETRKVPLDDEFRLRADAVDLTDAAAVVATVGTTSTTSVDPVPELADEGTDEENEAIVERVNRSGELFLSHTRLNDRYVIRLAVGNERTTEEDVRRAWSGILGVAPDLA